jgi:hypothetical protein
MKVEELAEHHRLRIAKDSCGEEFVPCVFGQIYHHGGKQFGALVINEKPARSTTQAWNRIGKALRAGGFALHQNGGSEGSLLFDSQNEEQAKLAIRMMRARKRRQVTVTPEMLSQLAAVRPARGIGPSIA